MFSEQRRREEQALLAHDYALETARAEGIEKGLERGLEQGLERGRAEGIEQGLERGRAEGIEQGRAEGIEQGLERGLERGKVEGREEGKIFAFLDMVRQDILTSEVASEQLGITVEEFESLL